MPKIHVLEKQVAELIAAGEVVERPSSVIKELVENSIDSGASIVTVEIRRGGVTYIRVTDNGCGIAREDVATAFLRHATSKVREKDDLDAILTLGFRGEALASISAVSRVDLITRTADSSIGTHYSSEGGSDVEIEDAGCPLGTTITARDLFFNVPARMKFLKKDTAEGNSVAGLMDKIALSHPEISFRLIREGKEVLHTPGDGKLSSAIYAVFGKEFSGALLPVDYTLGGIRVHGYISSPIASRPNRSMQNFFINGRFVRSRTACVALEEAYKGAIMVGKFPACVLHIELPSSVVDVNVHPAKLEVRFVNERPVFDAVYHGVKSAVTASRDMKSVDLAQHARRPVDPYKPDVVVKPQQMVLNPPPKTETVKPMPASVVKSAPVINTSKKEAEAPYEPPVDMPPMPHTFSDSAEREEKPQLESIRTSIERVLEAEPQPMTKPEVITEEPPLPQPPETEPVPPAWEETPVQTEAVQENPESNAQPETCIVPETERDLPRMAHKVIGASPVSVSFNTYDTSKCRIPSSSNTAVKYVPGVNTLSL